ncbi:carboxypeptidase regulatory-like domain-containing protein [Nonomuraea sp. NPDC026600]|uniref:carboxypeptidase regulatory-like domain-containing protein n=1 Tax=Nonomuraea sp. NPDC026600 TaxID=3155363 RepID=UPI0033F6853A
MSRLIAALLLSCGVLVCQPAAPAAAQAGTTYYVDASGGDDTASGLDEAHAWRSLGKVNATTFGPGDRVLLRAGQRWSGQLWPKGSGESGAPITIDRYGAGGKPRVDGEGQVGDAVRLFNQEFWTIRNLEVTNQVPATGTPGENLRDLRGVHVGGDNGQTLDGFVIDAVAVHDVTGEVNWISGSTDGNAPGIHFKTGWDGSKKTGGIVFDTTVPDIQHPPSAPTLLNDVVIENSTVANTSFAGIVVKQYTGDGKNAAGETIATPTGWGTREGPDDPKFRPHTNIVIRNNYVTQADTAYGCNGMYITNVRGAVIEHNVVHRTGTSGIEAYFADDITFQFNEVYGTEKKAGGADSNGIDPDKGTTRQVVQYNYLHGNGDGILLCQFAFGDVIVRNNVIASNSRYQIYLHSDRAANAKIYNNTLYNDGSDYLVYGYGSSLAAGYELTNNVFYSTRAGASLTTSPTIHYDHNVYGGATLPVPEDEAHAIIADPLFTDAPLDGPYGTAETGPQLETAYGLRVGSGSPAIDTGIAIDGNGGRDYAGTPLYNGKPDVGAFEYVTPQGATTETVAGTVRDTGGHPLPGVAVTVDAASVTTGSDGRFVVKDVPFADGRTLTASKAGYTTVTRKIDVRHGNQTTVELELASASVVGSISGRVLDQTARPVAGARVTVKGAGSATSSADGAFTVADVPVGKGYEVRAEADGYLAATRTGLTVVAATVTDAGAFLLAKSVPDYVATHGFDDLATGTLPTGTDGLTVSGSGGRVEVSETPSASDKSVKLTRTANSGSTSVSQTFSPALKGLVTVEADIMREEAYTSGNDWFGVPYIRGSNGQNAISLAVTKNTILAYSGTSTVTVGAYEPRRWYRLSAVIDTVNQRFDLLLDGRKVLDDAAFRTTMDGVAQIDYYANSSNYGSVHIDDVRVSQGLGLGTDDATEPPGKGVLSTTSGWANGLHDGAYDVAMNLWWGVNASAYVLYENGIEIARRDLSSASPSAQQATVAVSGRSNGTYTYTAELLNQAGVTATAPVTVVVTDANPAKAVLSSDNWDGDGGYTVRADLWWGTNATEYRLYEDGVLIDTRSLTAATPAAQRAATVLAARPPGSHTYVAELRNAAGATKTDPLVVTVTH